MKNVYIYIPKDKKSECLKYGIKLSEYTDKILVISKTSKKGIHAYLSPKDSEKYDNKHYVCIRIFTEGLTVFVYDKTFENTKYIKEKICKLEEYTLGDYEEPLLIICSSILPENIFLYNKEIDYPLIIENSKEYYYLKQINNIIDNNIISNEEIFNLLLSHAEKKKKLKCILDESKFKILEDHKKVKYFNKK